MIAVTGATGGLGSEICMHLAARGFRPVLLCRNEQKAKALMQRIAQAYPACEPMWVPLDLEDGASVCAAARQLLQLPITGLIHNAGVYGGSDAQMLRVNCASPLRLTQLLLPMLKARQVKVVLVGSIARRIAKPHSALKMRVYGHTKQLVATQLRRLCAEEGISFALAHPGITPTDITGHYPRWVRAVIRYPMKCLFSPPRKAALCILYALQQPVPQGGWVGPAVFGIWGKPFIYTQ